MQNEKVIIKPNFFKSFVYNILFLSFVTIGLNVIPTPVLASSIGLEPLNRACLPVLGRMQRTMVDACHCPPESYCPDDDVKWNEDKYLPPRIKAICCDLPKTCTVSQNISTACGGSNTLETKTVTYCYNYNVKSADYNGTTYKNTLASVNNFVTQLLAKREQIRVLSNAASSAANYAQVELLLAQMTVIGDQIKKLEVDANKADAKAKIEISCRDDARARLCKNYISSPCPPPPDPPPSCRMARVSWWSMSQKDKDDFLKKCPNPEYYDCVAEGTMVLMADGSKRAIQDIRVGEFVKGYNANNRVTSVTLEEEGASFLYSINDGKLNITAQHPILTTKGWKAINPEQVTASEELMKELTKLEVGDEIVIADEATLKVTKIGEYVGPKVSTYNLSVNGDKTFIANDIIIRAFVKNNSY